MSQQSRDELEMQVQRTARSFAYPPTPDVASGFAGQFAAQFAAQFAVRGRRSRRRPVMRMARLAVVVLLVVIIALLAVPEIRAQVLTWLRIGAVEVIVTTETPDDAAATPGVFPPGDLPASVLDYPGETTLDAARTSFPYPIPTSPELGAPDRIYLIAAMHPILVLAWLDDQGAVDTSLQLLPVGTHVLKMYDGDIVETQVNGARAIWLPGEHWYMLQMTERSARMRRVSMPALIWDTGDLTYRLETTRSFDEALRIAEGLSFGNG